MECVIGNHYHSTGLTTPPAVTFELGGERVFGSMPLHRQSDLAVRRVSARIAQELIYGDTTVQLVFSPDSCGTRC
jgi:hypothetical protein